MELRNGLAEVVKHGLIGDPQLFDQCTMGTAGLRDDFLGLIRRAAAVKVGVIRSDPYEQGGRAALNLGHTLGHGLELATDFRLRHGEAVSIGMVAAARLAERMKVAPKGLAEQVEKCLERLGLPVQIPPVVDRERLISAMGRDKKHFSGRLRIVLPERIGLVRWGVEIDDPARLVEVMD